MAGTPDWFDGDGGELGSAIDALALISDLQEDIAALVQCGVLVSIGTTSDAGALSCTVTLDGRYRRMYGRDREALSAWLQEGLEAVMSARGVQTLPPFAIPRQRPRRAR